MKRIGKILFGLSFMLGVCALCVTLFQWMVLAEQIGVCIFVLFSLAVLTTYIDWLVHIKT